MNHHDSIRAYFNCFRELDRATLRGLLADDFRHLSPFGEFHDPDQMIEAIWPQVTGKVWADDIRIFGDGPDYVVQYRHAGESAGKLAEYFRFDGERISEIIVYFGPGSIPGMPEK